MNDGLSVDILLAQGFCCGNQCSNCPYEARWSAGEMATNDEWIAFYEANPDKTYEDYEAQKK